MTHTEYLPLYTIDPLSPQGTSTESSPRSRTHSHLMFFSFLNAEAGSKWRLIARLVAMVTTVLLCLNLMLNLMIMNGSATCNDRLAERAPPE
eukprot:Ihof_evm4s533 gene=Ihof_evmTU4s533